VITHRPLPDGIVDRVVHLRAPVPTPRRDAPDNRLLGVAPPG